MGNWTVIGELGAGKTILSVGKIKEFLLNDKRVASNLDLNLEALLPYWSKQTYTRLMDYPQLDELQALGYGSNSKSEKTFGLLALDELSMWLNSHNWNAKGRDDFIVFQRHIRKRHWHTLFIAQDIESIDKQARNALVERVVRAGRTDRMRIPLLGTLLRLFGFSGNLPQWHLGEVHYGKDPRSRVQERWTYHGQDLYNAYNTDQHFHAGTRLADWEPYDHLKNKPQALAIEIDGCFTVLSPWHTKGRYMSWRDKNKKAFTGFIFITALVLFFVYLFFVFKNLPKHTVCGTPDSFMVNDGQATISVDGIVSTWPVTGNKVITKTGCYKLESKT